MRMSAAVAALAGVSLLATACAGGAGSAAPSDDETAAAATETGRVAISYPGGIAVLDPETLEVVDEFDTEEFTRLNAFGDGRTIAVTTSKGFQMLDTAEPALTDALFEATTAGHVVIHGENTVLFDDGTGTTTIVPTDGFADGYDALPEATTYTADAAHHGVSIVLEDGTLVTTVGDETSRTGAMALHAHDDHWDEAAASAECPGIHGEGTAADEAVVFGCEDGALLFKDETFTKLTAPDAYGRMGNAFVSETSPIVVGDYKNDPDAEGYLLSAVALIDTAAETLEVVDLPAEVRYTFRDIARGPGDLAYILSTDGQIHVLDPETGELTESYPVIEAWEGPAEWQDAHPAIKVDGDIAYVTEPAANSVHAVDLTTGEVIASVELDHTPNELAVAIG
ncbi:zinc metallochaperone AztD [Microbacterium sp. 179-I 3D3 NHS]|uniref:zinc metallochaperone AztD n=1 Tax=Microbacterium sp. 179-I 3D3 NHS TaxID=3142382 RepID=UPI0039A1B30D